MSQPQLPPHLSKPPTGPLEILIPENWTLSEPPRFGGKIISYLVSSLQDTTAIEFDVPGRSVRSSDTRLQEYLESFATQGDLARILQHCRAMMHPSDEAGAIGWFGAIQQEWAYTFHVFGHDALQNPKWEVRRRVRLVQTEVPEAQRLSTGLLGRLKKLFTRA